MRVVFVFLWIKREEEKKRREEWRDKERGDVEKGDLMTSDCVKLGISLGGSLQDGGIDGDLRGHNTKRSDEFSLDRGQDLAHLVDRVGTDIVAHLVAHLCRDTFEI